ncbi:NTP transferase domain-containing protein [Candidatus Woesearchaeota archaeon]|nr:NTP transferase domain-containing protein [Candidatus Woesearchaeota archaeon]
MKGVILAGGTGSRLLPLTKVTNKHLLPIYNKPMIYYPLQTLITAGVCHILIVCGNESAGDFLKLLGSGREYGVEFTYRVQEGSLGIANALSLAKNFVGQDKFVVILGDNVVEEDISKDFKEFITGKEEARLFLKEVPDPQRFGVAYIDKNRIVKIEEKPKNPTSNYVTVGIYMYSPNVFDIIRTLVPSGRGEYEITDVNNTYIKRGTATFSILKGFWSDAGIFTSLYRASSFIAKKGTKKK